MNICVIIPTNNDEENLPELLYFCLQQNWIICIIDNNSKDDTVRLASRYGSWVTENNEVKSLGRNIIQGFQFVQNYNASQFTPDTMIDRVVTIDTVKFNPEQLLPMLYLSEKYDLVSASRFLPFSENRDFKLNKLKYFILNKLFYFAQSNSGITDWFLNCKIFNIDLVNAILSHNFKEINLPEILAFSNSLGANIKEYPIEYQASKDKTSKDKTSLKEYFHTWLDVRKKYPSKPKTILKEMIW